MPKYIIFSGLVGARTAKNTGSFGRYLKYTFAGAGRKKTPRFEAGGLIPGSEFGVGVHKGESEPGVTKENIARPRRGNNILPITVRRIRTGGGRNRYFDQQGAVFAARREERALFEGPSGLP
ncbi:MAG: hypothetical protein ACYDBA_02240 [Sulfuricaulis sp.]